MKFSVILALGLMLVGLAIAGIVGHWVATILGIAMIAAGAWLAWRRRDDMREAWSNDE